MSMTDVWIRMDDECFVQSVQQAGEKLDSLEDEVLLDFSSVLRIDSDALRALGEVADIGNRKGVKVRLRGVNVTVYKVLKLAKLASRLSVSA
jgi:anti-anti-sigma regulatory factor